MVNYCKCEEYLKIVNKEVDTKALDKPLLQPESKDVESNQSTFGLSYDPFERMLLKIFILYTSAAKRMSSRPKKSAYQTLCSVSRDWRSTARKREWFAKTLGKYIQKLDNITADQKIGIHFEDQVTGITIRNDNLYIVSGMTSNIIQEYDVKNFNFLRDIKIEGTKELHIQDIVSSQTCDSMYASDSNNNCVWRITFGSSDKSVSFEQMPVSSEQLSLSKSDQVLTLSVSPPILAICFDQRDTRLAVSTSYIFLPKHMEHPLHVIQQSAEVDSATYLISHGRTNGKYHRICLVSNKGEVLLTYGDILDEMKVN